MSQASEPVPVEATGAAAAADSDGNLTKPNPVFDFRRPDRISKAQLRAIHNLHETFARNLGASLSAYLRAYLTASIVSVKQLAFHEFSAGLASPTCLLSLGLQPYEGNAVMELNPSLIFPMIELLLGGGGRQPVALTREITEIELKLLRPGPDRHLADTKRAMPNAAAAANPPINAVRAALAPADVPV